MPLDTSIVQLIRPYKNDTCPPNLKLCGQSDQSKTGAKYSNCVEKE